RTGGKPPSSWLSNSVTDSTSFEKYMKIFCQMPGNLNLGIYFCTAKKGRDGLCHQQVLAMQLDTVQLTYPYQVHQFDQYD
ncbi:MAG: hypothetical protein K5757_00200, partial [Bacteroidaceae bacterium]|nr:hypothetical protein [Bacteroidaceae bacterium]